MTSNLQGPTLSDAKGERRIRKLEDTRLNIWIAIIAAMDRVACIEHEIMMERLDRQEARYFRSLVDRPDLGELRKEGWL